MKNRMLIGGLALGLVAQGFVPPAHASTSVTILVPSLFSASKAAFEEQKCPASFASSGLQGIDAAVANVHTVAGHTVTVSWQEFKPVTGNNITAWYYPTNCSTALPATDASQSPGAWTLHPPANAYWVLFTITQTADVTVTLP